jgi:HSP20 family protein
MAAEIYPPHDVTHGLVRFFCNCSFFAANRWGRKMTREISKTEQERPLATSRRYPDAWSSFRQEMDSLFDNFFGESLIQPLMRSQLGRALPTHGDIMMPEVDLKETGKEIQITADLPGFNENDIDLKVADGLLTLSGEKKYEKTEEKGDYHLMERRFGSFRRSFRLPDSADTDNVAAVFNKGVLTVTIAKKKESMKAAKRIKIAQK